MVKAILNGTCLAETDSPIQVEGVQYFPPDSINQKYFKPSAKNLHTRCPWKGDASYYDVHLDDGKVLPDVAWYYPKLTTERSQKMKFEGYIAFYTARGVKVE